MSYSQIVELSSRLGLEVRVQSQFLIVDGNSVIASLKTKEEVLTKLERLRDTHTNSVRVRYSSADTKWLLPPSD